MSCISLATLISPLLEQHSRAPHPSTPPPPRVAKVVAPKKAALATAEAEVRELMVGRLRERERGIAISKGVGLAFVGHLQQ